MLEELLRLVAARPFVPFTIHTAAGEKVYVPTVDHIAVSPVKTRAVVFADDGSTILVSIILITQITADPALAAGTP